MTLIIKFAKIRKKLKEFFIIATICMSLTVGPVAGNEVAKMLECLSGARDAKIQELNEEGTESEDPDKLHLRK